MIDFHSHLLPFIDDGSKSTEESMEMLKLEYKQGVRTVAATPHFYAEKSRIDDFLYQRAHSYQLLKEEICRQKEVLPKILSGAEVLYFNGIGNAKEMRQLCLQDTNLLLLEMPFCQWDKEMLQNIRRLMQKQHLNIMLAHIDRYIPFQKDMSFLEEIWKMPVYIQANGGAFLRVMGRRKILHLIMQGNIHVLGSDCHNMDKRPPNLLSARKVIEQKLGTEVLIQIDENGRRILQDVKV